MVTSTFHPPESATDDGLDVPSKRSQARLLRSLRGALGSPLRWIVLAILVMLIVYPVYWLVRTAVYDLEDGFRFSELFETWLESRNVEALINSIKYGLITAGLSTLIAVPLAWVYRLSNLRFKRMIPVSAVVAFALPSYCIAISYIVLMGPETGLISQFTQWAIGWSPNLLSFSGMVTLSVLHLWPMAFLIVSAALGQMNESLRDASRSVGASDLRTTFRVELPLVRPAIFSAFILVYIYTLVLFSVPLLVGNPAGEVVLTTAIYGEYSSTFPDLAVVCSLALLFLIATIPAVILSRKATKRGRFTTGHTGGRRLVRLPVGARVILYILLGLVLLMSAWVPLGHFVVLSISDAWYNPTAGITGDHFRAVFDSPIFMRSLTNTLTYAVVTALVVTLLVALLAYVLRQRLSNGLRTTFETAAVAPFAIPGVVLAVGYILGFGREPFSLVGTMALLILAYAGHFIPVSFQALQPVYQQLDPHLDDAARIAGARLPRRLRTVLLPLLTPGLVSSGILVFISVAKELPLTLMLSNGDTVGISSLVINTFRDGGFSKLGALGLILIIVVLIAYSAVRLLEARLINSRRNQDNGRAKA